MNFANDLETHELIQPFVESQLQTEHARLVISKRPRICPSTEKANLANDIFFTEEAFDKYSVSSKWFENLWRKTKKLSTDQTPIPALDNASATIQPQIPPPQQILLKNVTVPSVVAPESQSVESVPIIINKPQEIEKKQKKEKKEKKKKKDKKEDTPKIVPVALNPASPKADPKKVAEAVLKSSTPTEAVTPPKTKFKPPSKRTKSTESVTPCIPITTPTSTTSISVSSQVATSLSPIPIPSIAESPVVVPQEAIVPTTTLSPTKESTSLSKPLPRSMPTEPTELGIKRTLRSYADIAPTALKKSKKETSTISSQVPTSAQTPSIPPSIPQPSIVPLESPITIPSTSSISTTPSLISSTPVTSPVPQPSQATVIPQAPTIQQAAIPQLPQTVSQIQPISRLPSQPQQRFSMFSESDHKLFLEFQQKFIKEQQRKTMPNAASIPLCMTQLEFQQYSQMMGLVTQEQEEYRSVLHAAAVQNKDIYTIFHPKIQKQVENLFAFKRQRVLHYPKLYDIHHVFDMRTIQPSNSHEAILKHKFTLLQKGKCLLFQKPSSMEIPLNRDYFPEASKYNNTSNTTTQSQPTETKEQVSANLSLPGATTDFQKAHWCKKSMIPLESDPEISHLASLGHKIDIAIGSSALCALMELNRQLEIPVTIKQVSDTDTRKLVIVGKPFVKKKMTLREMNTVFFNTAFESLGLQLPSSTVRCILFQDKRKNTTDANQPASTSITMDGASKNSSLEHENQLEDDNLTYNLWQFGSMNVLIRCKIHGMVPDKTQQGFRYVGMKTKMEYSSHKGSEEVTIAETALWWAYTFIRPDAHLMLARVNVLNNTVIEVEQKTMPAILPPGCLFKPEKSSRIIHTLFDKLCQLPLGNYLISHKVSDYNLVLLKSVDPIQSTTDESSSDKLYDLHQAHKNTPVSDTETVPYIPLRWVPKPNQIPETFPINKNTKSIFGSIGISHRMAFLNEIEPQYCQQFLTTGSCTAIGCGLLHARPEKTKKLKLKYCRNFAQFGNCNKLNCKYPHLKIEEVRARMDELGIQKKKKKKKKKKDKQSVATDEKHVDLDSKPSEMDVEDVASDNDFESQLAMHISKQKSNEPTNTNNATEDLAYIMSVLQ